ncbi:MAG: hypothetical protein K1X78_09710 [Verrucomicrobiaceae bacterium]|nr:hypothetical protein [Verrucomicrobiaceae bacterium]
MWKLTLDYTTTEDPRGKPSAVCSRSYSEQKDELLVHRFRLVDDDGRVCGEGVADTCGDERAFAPLDDFGVGAWGCSSIEYWQPARQQWEEL